MHSFAPQLICANTTSAPLICSSHGYEVPAQKLPEVDMIMKRKTLQWKNTKNYYEVKLAESSMLAMGIICANKIDIHLRHCYKFIVLL
jgi:hypothetical protein